MDLECGHTAMAPSSPLCGINEEPVAHAGILAPREFQQVMSQA